jgi:hypothetical protein
MKLGANILPPRRNKHLTIEFKDRCYRTRGISKTLTKSLDFLYVDKFGKFHQ